MEKEVIETVNTDNGSISMETFVTPNQSNGDLRNIFKSHAIFIASQHNANLDAKIAYISGGIEKPPGWQFMPMPSTLKAREVDSLVRHLKSSKVAIPSFQDGTSDVEFASQLLRVVLTLSQTVLPGTHDNG